MAVDGISTLATIALLGAASMTRPRTYANLEDHFSRFVQAPGHWPVPRTVAAPIYDTCETIAVPAGSFGSPTAPIDAVLADLLRFSSLGNGWDGDSAPEPSKLAIDAARRFLHTLRMGVPIPQAMLSDTGDPELYWDTELGYVDVRFERDGTVSYFIVEKNGAEFFGDKVKPSFDEIPAQEKLRRILRRTDIAELA